MDLPNSDPRLRRFFVVAAWASRAAVIYATLSTEGLVYRIYFLLAPFLGHPSISTYASFAHVLVYMIVGALFCAAYPRSTLTICLLLFLAIAGLEALQNVTADRHGTLRDAIEKMAGAASGVLLVRFALWWARTR